MSDVSDVRDKTVPLRRPTLDRLSRSGSEVDTGGGTGVTLTGVSLQIPRHLGYEAWEKVGKQLNGFIDSSAWWLGDWLIFGKERYADSYQQAIRAAGLSYQTLRNYAWVARRFTPDERRPQLTFQHHAEVVSLPRDVRDELLDRAEEQDWTTKQLREQVRGRAGSKPGQPGQPAQPGRPGRPGRLAGSTKPAHQPMPPATRTMGETSRLPKIEVVRDQLLYWRRAAEETGHDFESWVVAVLDRAAAVLLNLSAAECGQAPKPARATEGA